MDLIFLGGRVCTLDDAGTVAEAVGVSNGFIEALGSDDEVRRLAGHRTETVDLKGAVVFPGFMEAHNHLMMFGYLTSGLDLSPARVGKMDDILELVRAEAERLPAGTWIKGSRYAEYFLKENRHPTRGDLDRVSPEHPVILYHTSFHACVVNTRGLDELGITRETPVPEGGLIERDPATGDLTGVLHDTAMIEAFNRLFMGDLTGMSSQERIAMCGRASERFAELGLVSAADALVIPMTLNLYQETLAAGRLKVRVYTMNHVDFAEPLVEAGLRTGFGGGRLRIGPIKIFADGGMSNRTAAVKTPYRTPPHGRGLKIQSLEELTSKVRRFHDLGYQIAIHAQGDDGIGDVLDAYEAVMGPQSENPLRHRIEHGGCLYPDLLERAAAMNLLVAVQPVFFSELGDGFLEAFSPEHADLLYPFRSMLEAGLRFGGSSDCPVSSLDPRLGLRDAVLRRTPSGRTMGPDQVLTMDEALRMYTRGSAYMSFDEDLNGTIEPGKRADFTIMGADPREVPVEEVPDIPFVMTVVGGEIVYQADL